MSNVLFRSRRGGNPLSYSADDPTSVDDSTVLVFQTTAEALWVLKEDGTYQQIETSGTDIINAHSGLPVPDTNGDDDNKIAVSNDGIYLSLIHI